MNLNFPLAKGSQITMFLSSPNKELALRVDEMIKFNMNTRNFWLGDRLAIRYNTR